MHIGIIKFELTKGGGISHLALTLAERLCASDIDVTLVCTDTYRNPNRVGILKIKTPHFPTGRSLFFVKNSETALRKINTDLNLVLWHPGDQVAFHVKRRLKTPYILIYQGFTPFKFVPNHISKLNLLRTYLSFSVTLPAADAVVAISESMRAELKQHFSIINLVKIPNGIDTKRFMSNLPPEPIFEKYNVSDQFTLLYVGRIAYSKGLLNLLKAARIVKCRFSDFQLLVAGKGTLEREIQETAKRMGLSQNIKLLGFVPDHLLPHLYSFCDIFVFPTLWEGFGYPPLEAMASGKPVIASSVPSIREVVGDAGILVPPNNPRVLAIEILELIDNKKKRSHLGTKARHRAQKFDWSMIISRYKKLLESLASS